MAIDWALTIEKTYSKNGEGSFERWYTEHGSGSTSFPVTITGNYTLSGMTRDYRYTINAVAYSGNVPRVAYYLTTSPNTPASTVFQLAHPSIVGATMNFTSTSGCCVPVYVNNTYSFCQGNSPMSAISTNGTGRYPVTKHHISIDMPFCPIFATQTEAERYINGLDLDTSNALNNYVPETEPEGVEYTIYNTGQRGTWTVGNIVTDVSTPFYRWARVKLATTNNVDGRLAFYKVGLEDDIIKLKPVSVADIIYCEYSTDGGANWQTSDTFPYQYIYGERTNELGTFTYATRSGIGGASGVPVFEDETTALGWVNHDVNVDITDALNYEDIATRYKYTNKTGDNESETTMGTASGFRSHFTQKYLLDRGDVSIIANALFDTTTTIFEDIKKGLEMFGERIIDSICSLTYYPIDLTTVFTQLQNQSYIFFGGYQFQPENLNVNKLVGYSGFIDLGSFTIEPTFPNIEDARNYAPFCRVSIYLPYCGTFELDYNKYVNKTIRVRYYIDVNTGGCLVCLFDSATGGRLLDYMNGQIGSQIPITITDYSGYASAELRNISNLAGVGVNLVGSGIGVHSGVQTVQNATTQRAVEQGGGEIAKGILGVAQAPVDFAKAMYDLSTTSINQFNSTKGSSGALGNQYLPQYVYLIFAYVRTEETPNLLQLEGKPSNKSGTVGSFSGYLEVDSVQLQCSGATENEKRSIINMLNSGIII